VEHIVKLCSLVHSGLVLIVETTDGLVEHFHLICFVFSLRVNHLSTRVCDIHGLKIEDEMLQFFWLLPVYEYNRCGWTPSVTVWNQDFSHESRCYSRFVLFFRSVSGSGNRHPIQGHRAPAVAMIG